MNNTHFISADTLSSASQITHGFFTRNGGVSEGTFTSLNCGWGSGDQPDAIAQNRENAAAMLGLAGAPVITCAQIHSAQAVVADGPWDKLNAPEADSIVTTRAGLVIGVLSADCAPVLFADDNAGVIAAAHAGWRGALGGVLSSTIATMCAQGAQAKNIRAVVGPCIGQKSYEVGPEFRDTFLAEDVANDRWFVAADNAQDGIAGRAGHFRFDLAGFVAAQLVDLGAGQVENLNLDTCADETRFYSYRRATLRGEQDFGRGLSAIALKPV